MKKPVKLFDGINIAKELYEKAITPGQFVYQLLEEGKKSVPDFYRSDLQSEFDSIWDVQKNFYPDLLTDKLKEQLRDKNGKVTVICKDNWKGTTEIVGNKRATTGEARKKENYLWRVKALSEKVTLEQLVVILQEINTQIGKASGYLGAISDRSKELYFKKQTIGEFIISSLDNDPNTSLKGQVFCRQDYQDEFNTLWMTQSKYHDELTDELRKEICDHIIFYQRRLKSQKGLISFCEFEHKQIEVEEGGIKKTRTIGQKVVPRSSPLFQEFRIWQNINNIRVFRKEPNGGKKILGKKKLSINGEDGYSPSELPLEGKELLFHELSIRKDLKKEDILKLLNRNPKEWDMNYEHIEGNTTQATLFDAYNHIIECSGHDPIDFDKYNANEIYEQIEEMFKKLKYNTDILHFYSEDEEIDRQPMYRLWHLLYSFDGDDSLTGREKLVDKLCRRYGFEKNCAAILTDVIFIDDYGNLSAKAIRKILPFLKDGSEYSIACEYAGYRHSKSSLTREEIKEKTLKNQLPLLPKNKLRNPVVENILNQMVHVVNAIVDTYGKPDEIRVELARELKKSKEERESDSKNIVAGNKDNEAIREKLKKDFELRHISRNDIIRYKLYDELKNNGYKTLYSDKDIQEEELFSGKITIEHIIPKARLFDDSLSNKTLEFVDVNIEKGNKTAFDFVKEKYGEEGIQRYLNTIDNLFQSKKTKLRKLKMSADEIPEGFIERELRDTQYIAKTAKMMLESLVGRVVSTTGSITKQLREDWQLVDVMKDLNWNKYENLGLTEVIMGKNGQRIRQIKNWDKRNDHRHHAVDALAVAFTKEAFVQYYNNLNARSDKNSTIYAIEKKYFDGRKAISPIPLPEFREEVKKHLEETLISIKARNKVATNNINTIKKRTGVVKKRQLTPRGQLHNEHFYRRIVQAESKGDIFTLRKKVDRELNISKVIDKHIKRILEERLNEFSGDAKKAFSNLEENPIWLNKEKGISIKRVAVKGIRNGVPLHTKKDKDGRVLLDSFGNPQLTDFIDTDNNHHVAIYQDEYGKLQEKVVSFLEVILRKTQGLPSVDKDHNKNEGWEFLFSVKKNEYFVFPNAETGFDPKIVNLMDPDNYVVIAPNLFRVQTISTGDYRFRHHCESTGEEKKNLKGIIYKRLSLSFARIAVKVRVDHIGRIVSVGEY